VLEHRCVAAIPFFHHINFLNAIISARADKSARSLRHRCQQPEPSQSLTFLILIVYWRVPDIEVFGTGLAMTMVGMGR